MASAPEDEPSPSVAAHEAVRPDTDGRSRPAAAAAAEGEPAGLVARLRAWARTLKRDVMALRSAALDDRVPWYAKALAAAVAAYALSPIDLIPDFIPVVGYLDDLIIVPLGLWFAIRLIPPDVMAEHRAAAADAPRLVSPAGAAVVIAIWLLGLAAIGVWLYAKMG